jgi:hypothetical protein
MNYLDRKYRVNVNLQQSRQYLNGIKLLSSAIIFTAIMTSMVTPVSAAPKFKQVVNIFKTVTKIFAKPSARAVPRVVNLGVKQYCQQDGDLPMGVICKNRQEPKAYSPIPRFNKI